MRRGFAFLSAIVLLLTVVGGAAGARPSSFTERAQDVGCSDIATQAGTANFYVRVSDLYGPEAYLDVWAGEPYSSDLVYQRDWGQDAVISFAPTVSITIPLLPSGVAVIAGETTPVGSIDVSDRFRDGNVQVRITSTGTQSAFSGSLQLPGDGPVPVDPASCGSSDTITTQSATQPNARVRAWSSTGGVCDLVNEDGDSATVFFSPFEGAMLAIDGWATDSGGGEVGFFGAGEIVGGAASFPIEEYDTATGEPTGIPGSADVSLTETGDDASYVIRSSNDTVRVTGSLTDVDGSLATSIGVFDLDPCVISAQRIKEITTPSNGPKPGGKRPANDLPSGAVTLTPGARTTVATKGAQQASEAAFPCMVFTDEEGTEFVVPVERTVWYRITGTGGEITVDTAGSSFDTVAAAYEGAPDASSTVACIDDVPVVPFGRTLQAAVTFPTIAGVTYYVQVGGYLESDGINVPYGTLKVAVR